jgi:hypothetical protein
VALFCRLATYVFKLLDSASNRHIVQIFNEDTNTHLCDCPRDTELSFACDRQNGNHVHGKGRSANRKLSGRGFIREIIWARNLCIEEQGSSSWRSKPIRP